MSGWFTWRRVAHLLLTCAGLALAVWGLVAMSSPQVTCRGVEMHPGDTCRKSTYTQVGGGEIETYELRVHSQRQSRPVVVVTGLAVAGFGATLLVQDVRRRKPEA